MKGIRNFFISLLAFIYLILEYLFWDTLLEPIYRKFKELQLYQSLLFWISEQHTYFILFIFVLFFGISEMMGIWALAILAQGMVGLFVVIYIIKFLPVAIAFTILENSKERLLTIRWFAFLYNFTMKLLHKIKTNPLFLKSQAFLDGIKYKIKSILDLFKKEKNSKITLFKRIFFYIIKKKRR